MKNGILHKILVRVLPFLAAWTLRILFATCRIKEHGTAFRKEADAMGKPMIATFWHYSLVYIFYHLRQDSGAVLVSASEDGEYIARLARHLNFTTIRGSRNRRGLRAIKELKTCLESGGNIGMVADGSQGPAQVVQGGSILLASKTGSPILPMVWSASSCFTFRSWDRTAIPKPFSRINFYYDKPFLVSAGLDAEEFEEYRLKLEGVLNNLYHEAWAIYGKDKH